MMLPVQQVSLDLVQNLRRFCIEVDPRTNVGNVLKDAEAGNLTIWKHEGENSAGYFLLRVLEHPNGKELEIYAAVGENLLLHGEEIITWIEWYARQFGCRWLTLHNDEPRLDKYYEKRLRMSPKARTYTREILRGH